MTLTETRIRLIRELLDTFGADYAEVTSFALSTEELLVEVRRGPAQYEEVTYKW